MDAFTIACLAILCMFVCIALHVPIGIAMGVVGVVAYSLMTSPGPALSLVGQETVSAVSSPDLAVIPLFLLMGNFASASGISIEIYNLAYALLGHRRGGLAMATVGGCSLFGAVCGSSFATVATFGRVALPEMTKRGYDPALSSGCVAASGNLGALIPPSIILVIYAVLAEEFILQLFIAAIIPALLTILIYFIVIYIYARMFPERAPAGDRVSWSERLKVARKSWTVVILILLILIGIYGGVFTVNEAASLGAILAFGFGLLRRKFTWKVFWETLADTASSTAMIYTIIIGSNIFNYFIVLSHIPDMMTNAIVHSGWPTPAILVAMLMVYLILGSVFDTISAMVITLPFVLPLIVSMGYSTVWWGIVNLIIVEIGLITPPIGMNVFVLHGVAGEYSLPTIFRGIAPFLCGDFVRITLIMVFPAISTWLPSLFR